jgi:hypothetical protein
MHIWICLFSLHCTAVCKNVHSEWMWRLIYMLKSYTYTSGEIFRLQQPLLLPAFLFLFYFYDHKCCTTWFLRWNSAQFFMKWHAYNTSTIYKDAPFVSCFLLQRILTIHMGLNTAYSCSFPSVHDLLCELSPYTTISYVTNKAEWVEHIFQHTKYSKEVKFHNANLHSILL